MYASFDVFDVQYTPFPKIYSTQLPLFKEITFFALYKYPTE